MTSGIEPDPGPKVASKNPLLRVHFLKSNFYRVVHADGAYGGISPQGLIQIYLYSERAPLPTSIGYALSADGQVGPEIPEARESRDGLVREIEVGATMTLQTAIAVHQWLGNKIEQLKAAQKERRGRRTSDSTAE
jgi:hypothetical protein